MQQRLEVGKIYKYIYDSTQFFQATYDLSAWDLEHWATKDTMKRLLKNHTIITVLDSKLSKCGEYFKYKIIRDGEIEVLGISHASLNHGFELLEDESG